MKNSVKRLLETDIDSVIKLYPDLEVIFEKGNITSLEGHIDVLDTNLEHRGEFNVRINIPDSYPNGFPTIRELSKKIPREIDRHIYDDGNCCLTILQKQILEARRGISILEFVEKYVIPYLANQIYFDDYGNWANGEYLHGDAGIAQFYLEEINAKNFSEVLKVLDITLNSIIQRNQLCYCGSGIKFKKCHLQLINRLRLIGRNQLKRDLEIISLHH